jgi:type I restriction enzyme R subunit
LIQYKSEVMLRIFEESVKPLIESRAKALIVAGSRVDGLRYFKIVKEKLRERRADYKVLYAFSDFVHPETNAAVREHAVNGLNPGELIEDRFEGRAYRLMVVANKFQAGFDQPLLAGMFLDKPVMDRNAVQTISRLNRCHEGKQDVVVVDFTNNARNILKAFAKYRKGSPFAPEDPDEHQCAQLYEAILAAGVFTQMDAEELVEMLASGTDAQVQFRVNALRQKIRDTTSDSSPVHPREVFADTLLDRASGIIVAHSHPAGELSPSEADSDVTERLRKAGKILGIELLDHIIFNRTGYYSFLENGKL